jgi:outer membrane lipoprotein SlyB
VQRTARQAPATYRDSEPVKVKQTRSTKKSVAIVAGGAATGAAIGAMAGGGKGAAIGAISGGAAGLIYDRMTKNNGDKIF